jgi:heme-degrading monooxygenase HmoA
MIPRIHVRAWSFQVRPGRERKFEAMYGPEGDWVRLLRRGDGYIGTEVWRRGDGVYLTIDRWRSEEAYEAFRAGFAAELEEVDRRGEKLTKVEELVGLYEVVGAWPR